MKPMTHWAGQYLLAGVTMFGLLVGVDMARGTRFADAWIGALAWAALSSAIFIGSRIRRARRGADCAACGQADRE